MGSLWASEDEKVWQESLAEVGMRLEALENPKLTALEGYDQSNKCILISFLNLGSSSGRLLPRAVAE